jgi:hypothetical protein
MMIKRSDWILQIGLLIILLTVVTVGSAKGFAERFRDFVLDSNGLSKTDEPRVHLVNSSQSRQCMSCHDGSSASPVTLKHADTSMRFSGHGSVNHPVGMRYANYANSKPAEYVPLEDLDRRIILEDGEVTCVSCHETKDHSETGTDAHATTTQLTYSDNGIYVCSATKRLTTGTSSTTLCLSCHAM